MENYLKILEESLKKKLKLLEEIQAYNEAQHQVFTGEEVILEKFDEYIAEKEKLIQQVIHIDDGFEILYDKKSNELQANREKYAGQIKVLQELVRQVTEKHVAVQAQETRNKALIEAYFAKEKNRIGQGRRVSKAAYSYYSNINKVAQAESRFMDSRQ